MTPRKWGRHMEFLPCALAWQFIKEFPCSWAHSHACFVSEGIQCETQGIFFLRTWLFLSWSWSCSIATLGAELTWQGIRLSSLCEVTWTRCVCESGVLWITLQRQQLQPLLQQFCHNLVHATPLHNTRNKNIYSSHLSLYFCLLSLFFSLSLFLFLFISGRMHPKSQTIDFSPEIVARQLLSHSMFLNGFIYIYIIYVFLKKKQAFWMQGQFQSI